MREEVIAIPTRSGEAISSFVSRQKEIVLYLYLQRLIKQFVILCLTRLTAGFDMLLYDTQPADGVWIPTKSVLE